MTFTTRIVFHRTEIASTINDMVTNLGWTFVSITPDTCGGTTTAFVVLFSKQA